VLAFSHLPSAQAAPSSGGASTVNSPMPSPMLTRRERITTDEETESRQVEWVVGHALHRLKVSHEGPIYSTEAGFGWPHPCPLTLTPKLVSKYRKKLRSLLFVDLTPLILEAASPSALAEAMLGDGGESCVFLFTYGELVDGHPLLKVLSQRGCTLLFVPASHIKEATERLGKLSEAMRASRVKTTAGAGLQSLSQQLVLAAISGFHEEFLVPIVVVNPPSPTNHIKT